MSRIEKWMQEEKDRAFLESADETCHRIELLAGRGFDTLQAIGILISMSLESIDGAVWGGGDFSGVAESLDTIAGVASDCLVRNSYGGSIAVTGTI